MTLCWFTLWWSFKNLRDSSRRILLEVGWHRSQNKFSANPVIMLDNLKLLKVFNLFFENQFMEAHKVPLQKLRSRCNPIWNQQQDEAFSVFTSFPKLFSIAINKILFNAILSRFIKQTPSFSQCFQRNLNLINNYFDDYESSNIAPHNYHNLIMHPKYVARISAGRRAEEVSFFISIARGLN